MEENIHGSPNSGRRPTTDQKDPDNQCKISSAHIYSLIRRFVTRTYSSYSNRQDQMDQVVNDTILSLWEKDYMCEKIENTNGVLCATYPSKIPIPMFEHVGGKIVSRSPLSKVVLKPKAHKSNTKTSEESDSYSDEGNFDLELDSEVENPPKSVETSDSCRSKRTLTFDLRKEKHQSMETSVDPDIDVIKETNEEKVAENIPTSQLRVWPSFNIKTDDTLKIPLMETPKSFEHKGLKKSGPELKTWLTKYLKRANMARCRYRFPVPVIFYKGKYISRAATISCYVDVCGKQIIAKLDPLYNEDDTVPEYVHQLDKARSYDIKLLKKLDTSAIVDLMVENKKLKCNIPVSSSEKADKEKRYSEFKIFSLPYPGCEFFKEFSNNEMCSSNLYYDWKPAFNDANLSIPEDPISSRVCTDWASYKEWDLRSMTENYLKLILRYITDNESNESGILVHCISGWDRTPLFISLIRLSLWADGLIHSSLNAKEMLYFTIAYDWYLFGHQLPDRLKYKENILFFCFEFLDVMSNDSFMEIRDKRERHPSNSSWASGAYDSAAEGTETTTSSSFGSVTSLASSSSSNPPSTAPSIPNIKVSSLKPQSSTKESNIWPFNKENEFSFEGIAENEKKKKLIGAETNLGVGCAYSKKASPIRSPLKERNKASSKNTPSPSGKRTSGRRGTLNGVLRELTSGKRSRKSSTGDSPSSKTEERPISGSSIEEYEHVTESEIGQMSPSKTASNPVPVPGVRSRHNSSSSSMGSWHFVSSSDGLDTVPCSFESVKSSCRASFTAEMVDSTHTIKEEVSPSSSVGSSHGITVFNRKERLLKIRKIFYDIYDKVPPPNVQPGLMPKFF